MHDKAEDQSQQRSDDARHMQDQAMFHVDDKNHTEVKQQKKRG